MLNRNELVGKIRVRIMEETELPKNKATALTLEILEILDSVGYDGRVEKAIRDSTVLAKDDPNASWNLPK